MYGLYIDDVKGTCSPITDTMCVKYKKNYCCFGLVKAGLLQKICISMHFGFNNQFIKVARTRPIFQKYKTYFGY